MRRLCQVCEACSCKPGLALRQRRADRSPRAELGPAGWRDALPRRRPRSLTPRLPRSTKVRSPCQHHRLSRREKVLTEIPNLCPSARSAPPPPPPTFRPPLDPTTHPPISLTAHSPSLQLPCNLLQSRWPKSLPPRTPCGSSVSRSSSSVRLSPKFDSRSHPAHQSTRRPLDETQRGK